MQGILSEFELIWQEYIVRIMETIKIHFTHYENDWNMKFLILSSREKFISYTFFNIF